MKEILRRAERGEDLLDNEIVDIALDQFIQIRKLASSALKGME